MQTDLIIVREYCRKCHIDPSFVVLLGKEGLIDIRIVGDQECLLSAQLQELERYTRLYYDLSINIEGIDAICHLPGRIKNMQDEINHLRSILRVYRTGDTE